MWGDPSGFDKALYVAWGAIEAGIGLTGPPSLLTIVRADYLRRPAYCFLSLTWIAVGGMIALSPWLYSWTPYAGICVGVMAAQAVLYTLLPYLWTRSGQPDGLFLTRKAPGELHVNAAAFVSACILCVLCLAGAYAIQAAPTYARLIAVWVEWTGATASIVVLGGSLALWRHWKTAATDLSGQV